MAYFAVTAGLAMIAVLAPLSATDDVSIRYSNVAERSVRPFPVEAAAAADTVQVLLTLAERLNHSWARATIIRPAGDNAPDMIVVSPETTPEDLDKAIRMLLDSRQSVGEWIDQEISAHVSPRLEPLPPGETLVEMTDFLARLAQADSREIPEFGVQRAVLVQVVREVEAES